MFSFPPTKTTCSSIPISFVRFLSCGSYGPSPTITYFTFLTFLPILGKKVKNVKYVIVGEGPYEPQLKNLTKDMGMEEQVVFVGGKENIQPFYCMADLFVLLSYGEGMPLAILSAMASWLPVIASKQKPFDEII